MAKSKKPKVEREPVTHEQVRKALEFCDGHTIWEASAVQLKTGLPQWFIDSVSFVHESDYRDHKTTLTSSEGKTVDRLQGIYGKTLTEALCDHVGVSSSTGFGGRGTHARALIRRIAEALDNSN